MKKILLALVALLILSPGFSLAAYNPGPRLTFTFDDGNLNVATKAAPLFATHNMPAVIYGETLWLESGEPWVMTWDQLKQLRDSQGWEIASHTVTHPNLTTLTDQQLESELLGSKQSFANHGIATEAFATPMGLYDDRVLKAISKYYTSHRAAWAGPIWPGNQNDYELVSLEVKHDISPQTVKGWIDQAIANNQWLILLLHDVVDGVPQEYEYNKNDLKTIVDYAASRPIKITTTTKGLAPNLGTNLVSNNSFETVQSGFAQNWTRDNATNVTIDTNNNGNSPASKNSLKIVAGSTARSVISNFVTVENSDYVLRFFQNGQNMPNGGTGVWISEFNTGGTYLGGQWLGGTYTKFFGVKQYDYKPTSSVVGKIQIVIYTEAGASGTLYIDSVNFAKVGGQTPPPPTPDTTKPVIGAHANVSVTTTSTTGTAVTYTLPTVTDNVTAGIVAVCSPASGSNFAVGTTVVTCNATDAAGNTAIPTTFSVIVTFTAPPPTSTNLISNPSFETVGGTGFATGWTNNSATNVKVDTANNGYAPSIKNSIKITGTSTQNTLISPMVTIDDPSKTYEISYFAKTTNWVSGGTAIWINEFDLNHNWIGGQWLGGQYQPVSSVIVKNYKPTTTATKFTELHIFTESGSQMTLYIDQVSMVKK